MKPRSILLTILSILLVPAFASVGYKSLTGHPPNSNHEAWSQETLGRGPGRYLISDAAEPSAINRANLRSDRSA